MTFTDMHSGSSVCTTTRYGLLTGRYAWRTKLQKGVVQGHAPCLIDSHTLTIAEMLTKIVEDGRSTPVRKLKNDTEDIDIWKGITPIDFKK